jgi:peptide/nickel transport system substrate-binding protein
MEESTSLKKVLNQLTEEQISRRKLIQRAGLFAAAATSISTLLAACADDDDPVDDEDVAAEEPEDTDDSEEVEEEVEEETDDAAEVDDESTEEDDPDDDESTEEDDPGDDDGIYGGTLRVALLGEPPRIDTVTGTGFTVNFVAWNIWETLLTWDENFDPVPELLESLEVSDDGLNVTLILREGVMFHNGEEMTSADVAASIQRWSDVSPLSGAFQNNHESIEPIDDYTIEIAMQEPLGPLTTLLSRQAGGCAISPQSIVEAAGEDAITEFVGTGPYKFVEYQPDQHILVERFEDYSSRDEEPSGYAGRKYQYLDEMYFIPVPDEAARLSGAQAGDYHFLETIGTDQYEVVADDPELVAEIYPPQQWGAWVLNTQDGVLANQVLRQAIQAALDCEEMLMAGYGEGFYRLDPSLMFQESAWYSTAGEEYYNQANPEHARELAEEAGYDGEPIRLMTSQEYMFLYNMAQICQQQLEDAGFNIDLQTMDWTTLQSRRNDPTDWEIFTTFHPFFADPVMFPHVAGTTWAGWWDTEQKIDLANRFIAEIDFETRFAIWEELQLLHYEEVPQIKIGDASEVGVRSVRLMNPPTTVQVGASFWNSWLDE